jgi:hypothetical protein
MSISLDLIGRITRSQLLNAVVTNCAALRCVHRRATIWIGCLLICDNHSKSKAYLFVGIHRMRALNPECECQVGLWSQSILIKEMMLSNEAKTRLFGLDSESRSSQFLIGDSQTEPKTTLRGLQEVINQIFIPRSISCRPLQVLLDLVISETSRNIVRNLSLYSNSVANLSISQSSHC